jgi:hypothetical protein
LVKQGIPYKKIQDSLKEKYGSGMSNTTLKKITRTQSKLPELENKLKQTEQELALFK